jgi:glycosyltransferase involved in cell wall biosynthesis
MSVYRKNPEFTFVIPIRNEGTALDDTLSHLVRLGDPDLIEVILVDDASDIPVADQYRIPHDITCLRNEVRQGVAKARNQGARRATGDTLVFTDGHVGFSRTFLEDLRLSGVARGNGICGCATSLMDCHSEFRQALATGESDRKASFHAWRISLEPNMHVRPVLLPDTNTNDWCLVPYVGACSLAISRVLFDSLGGFDEGLIGFGCNEDLDLAMRCWSSGLSVRTNPRATCWHLTQIRKTPDRIDNNPYESLDLTRYSGSFMNTIRVVYLYFPDEYFARFLSIAAIDHQEWLRFVGNEIHARRSYLRSRMTISPHELLERMTAETLGPFAG